MRYPALTASLEAARSHLPLCTSPSARLAVDALHEYARKGGNTRAVAKHLGRARDFAACLPLRSEERAATLALAASLEAAIGA